MKRGHNRSNVIEKEGTIVVKREAMQSKGKERRGRGKEQVVMRFKRRDIQKEGTI
jgi:hypothetical protein